MDYERLYEWRHRHVDQQARAAVWGPIARYVHELMDRPRRVLDPAAGRCEFINAVPAEERWAVDQVRYVEASPGTHFVQGDATTAELPEDHFDGVFVSNFLEHLFTPDDVAAFLARMRERMADGGRIAIMGPNYRYCGKEYWDYADHYVALTHVAVEEHLYAAGLTPTRTIRRFLPYTFSGRMPASARLATLYLRVPLAWRLLGKQFLVVAEK
ncbi:MAG: class I SAM-dependent methyltransferase [Solirubrobacterales bacterium]|nr:class I SAM-dependent methyltransferase [Solirubrobacterales bacterium]